MYQFIKEMSSGDEMDPTHGTKTTFIKFGKKKKKFFSHFFFPCRFFKNYYGSRALYSP